MIDKALQKIKVTILGCGGAGGVPSISSGWGECESNNPKNQRLRSSILVEKSNTKILIDASPDLREQFLTNKIKLIDSVLFTHGHADHSHGINELREINRVLNGPLNIWADQATLSDLMQRYSYAFEGIKQYETIYKPWLIPNIINTPNEFQVKNIIIKPFSQIHGNMTTLGFRINNFAYTTDLNALTKEGVQNLHNLDTWVIGCLTNDINHPTHVSIDEAIKWVDRFKPRQCIITHMGPTLDYDRVEKLCSSYDIKPAFDGMVINM